MKNKIAIVVAFLILPSVFPAGLEVSELTTGRETTVFYDDLNDETEYWALVVPVGVYEDHPEADRLHMFYSFERFYDMLLVSEHWKEDHIRVIKGENATKLNIIKGLKWLDEMDDENDISLVYFTSHGGPGLDLPPFDEKDGHDEYLSTYRSFKYPFPLACIRDDELNYFLSCLDSEGLCVVIASCHAGGFNDPPFEHVIFNELKGRDGSKTRCKDSARLWMKEFSEIKGKGRVVLMSCGEDETGSGWFFLKYLVEGLQGFSDGNKDGMCTAEESFTYLEPRVQNPRTWPTI
jgi:hypothetical protein